MTQAEYLEKRGELQREISALRPVDYDDLNEAADLIGNFRAYWDTCGELDKPAEARKELVARIVQRVYVRDQQIVAVVFHPDFAVVLGENVTAHALIARAAQKHWAEGRNVTTSISSQNGDDGSRPTSCILLLIPPYTIKDHPIFASLAKRLSQDDRIFLWKAQSTSNVLHC